MQERARADADLDDTWGGDDQEYDFHRTSRSSTPENDFIDVEGNERPHSAASQRGGFMSTNSGPSTSAAGSGIPPLPPPPQSDVKRGRGRPRKQRDTTVEEGTFILMFSFFFNLQSLKFISIFDH